MRPGSPTATGTRRLLHAVGDVGTGAPTLQHLRDDFGRILEVGVHNDGGIAAACSKPAAMAISWPKLRESEYAHARIGAVDLPQDVQRGIAAAVVYVDALEVQIGDGFQRGNIFGIIRSSK